MDRPSITNAQISAFRLHRHHLDVRAPRTRLPSVVRDVCGVQAQVTAMARIALWARLRQLTVDDVERALVRKRTIVKTWSMRGALHLLASDELLLYLAGLMPTRLPREQRWIRGAGLKEEETTAMVLDALKEGPLTRAQLVDHLAKRLGTKTKDWFDGGWGRQTTGSNTSWQLVKPAVMRGLVCFGPSHGPEITFTKVDEWLREPQSMPAEAEAEDALVRRHLGSFGPADVSDLWAWSGVYVRRLRVILDRLGDELVEVDRGGRPGFLLKKDLRDLEKAAIDGGGVRLLPSFDPFLLGHRNRDHLVDRAHYKRVYKDQGWLAPVVLVDGRVAGTWSYDRGPKKLGVDVTMFSNFDRATRKKVTEEAQDLSRFFEAPEMAIRFH
ncbi:MAG: winged helix DNA-binding domain-containing protein [Methanobacteriota archaeon]|nr:MAG: winged helix DNA-binding domain-containing protein [Euryarchaeota archaeon]